MSRPDDAVSSFDDGFNCAQAVLSAYAPELGLQRELAQRVAGGFGGGMGRMGETCGAVTGAFMVIGLRYACSKDSAVKEETYQRVREFAEQFRARHGGLSCRELLGCDISNPAGRQAVREKGLFTSLCPQLVRSAAEILEGLL